MNTEHCRSLLEKKGYRVKVCSEYHLEVKKPKSNIVVSVWPTASKVLKKYAPGPAPQVRNLIQTIEEEFLPFPPMPPLPAWQQECVDLLTYWRENWYAILNDQEVRDEYFALL